MTVEITTREVVMWVVLAFCAVGGFVWAAGTGQFDDLDRAARLPLEEDPPESRSDE
jgi:cbb3-type cytochrome oxidase maturation protein